MIPGDLASRLRILLENAIQPVTASREIGRDQPGLQSGLQSGLQPGERFTAQIQSALPDGTFRALVAGRSVTLALPDTAKTGDVLELTVTANRGETVFARLGATPADAVAANTHNDVRAVLSNTAQLISQLLTGRHGEAEPLPLGRTDSLLPATLTPTAQHIAPALQQAVNQSGLFYESHLRQWTEGARPLQSIQGEPQAALLRERPDKPALIQENTLVTERNADSDSGSDGDAVQATRERSAPYVASAGSGSLQRIPEPIAPIVLQQLETLACQQASWQGQVWPGARMQWSVVDPDGGSSSQEGGEQTRIWRSRIGLQLPHLGNIEAIISLAPGGLDLRIAAAEDDSAGRLRESLASLQNALEAAGLPPARITVRKDAHA